MSSIFLKLDGFSGESCDERHQDWIDVLEVRWAGTRGLLPGLTDARERSCFDSLTVVKTVDKSSPKLAVACACGRHIRDALIECVRPVKGMGPAGKEVMPFYRIWIGEVVICGIESRTVPCAEGALGYPTQLETVSLDFGEIKWEYIEFKPDGTKAGGIVAGWSRKTEQRL